jgi:hypothetical protein
MDDQSSGGGWDAAPRAVLVRANSRAEAKVIARAHCVKRKLNLKVGIAVTISSERLGVGGVI